MESIVSPERLPAIEQTSPAAVDKAARDSAPARRQGFDLAQADPDVVARLEWLDDVMFAAINGDPSALESAAGAWRKMLGELGSEALEESRRQYLRHAQSVWNDLRAKPNQPPQKMFAAIEIISLLADKAW
jgi:hypothetical protein